MNSTVRFCEDFFVFLADIELENEYNLTNNRSD